VKTRQLRTRWAKAAGYVAESPWRHQPAIVKELL
jgi:hypothetical protein